MAAANSNTSERGIACNLLSSDIARLLPTCGLQNLTLPLAGVQRQPPNGQGEKDNELGV